MQKRILAALLAFFIAVSAAVTVYGADRAQTKKTITFYGFSDWVNTEPYRNGYLEAKEQFEEQHPDFTVELRSDPWSDWTLINQTMFASGEAADVMIVGNDMLSSYAVSGYLLDLDEYLDAAYFDGFFENVLQMYIWEDSHMAIPFTTDDRILWCNREIFEEAGLDPEDPPHTWAELLSCACQITEKTGKPGFGMDLGLKEFPAQSLLCASDYSLLTIREDGTILPNVKDEAFSDYLNLLNDLKETFQEDYANMNHHEVAASFAAGEIGMIIGNTLVETDIYEKDFGVQAPVPVKEEGAPQGSFGGGFGIAVNSETRYPEEALAFAKLLCDPGISALASDIPASYAGAENCVFAKDERFSVIMDQIGNVRQVQPKTLFYTEIETAVYDTVARVLLADADIDQEINKLDLTIRKIVADD